MNAYCVPFALGFVTGKTPDQIAELIAIERGEAGQAVRRVSQKHYLPVLKRLGFRILATVAFPGMTVRKWAAVRSKWGDNSTWLVRKSGHLFVYRAGLIYDNNNPEGIKVDLHSLGRCRLVQAWQIGVI